MSFARFKHWFTNVFWYHYKWATLGGLFALLVVVTLLVSVFGQRSPDVQFLMVKDGYFPEDAETGLHMVLYESIGDINGDAVPYYEAQMFDLSTNSDMGPDFVIAANTRFAGTLASHEASLIFYAEGSLHAFESEMVYLDLEAYGIQTGSDNPYRLDVTAHPAIQSAGFGETRVYAAVLGMTRNRDDPSDLYVHQTMALEVLRHMKNEL